MSNLPETILQFGSGRFLRGFADLFIHHANQDGQNVGRIVVVQSTGGGRANALERQGGRYRVLVRGLEGGQVVDRVEESASISRALPAAERWADVLAFARAPQLRLVLSNTAEEGYKLDPADTAADAPPRSFPAKLLQVLKTRFEAGQPPLTLVPRGLILGLVQSWGLSPELGRWVETQCRWHNTLVDRIVVNPPPDDPRVAGDELAVVGEPYALWAVEVKDGGGFIRHPAVRVADDVQPYFLRKVRILNAAHTALVCKAMPRGFTTVRRAVEDSEIGPWLERLLFEEIVPVLEGRCEGPREFARQTLERFRNPFQEHKLEDIAKFHDAKVKIRLVPTKAEFTDKFGRTPPLLTEVLASAV
jgi:tagaturonate reductase